MAEKPMRTPNGILIMLHCRQHTGYAIEKLERTFKQAALKGGYTEEKIFWAYSEVLAPTSNIIKCEYQSKNDCIELVKFVKTNNISSVLAFDLPYPAHITTALKRSGIQQVVAYWGASMSGLNSGLKLWAKRLEWYFRRHKPDVFIFESKAMARTATHGRGIPQRHVITIPLGVDTETYSPAHRDKSYIHRLLEIPMERKIIFYSGHMEERKGIRVLVNAAIELVDGREVDNVHFVICGNKGSEADPYLKLLENRKANDHVTFAGYRDDIPSLMSASHIGVIASSGWDSFTMSSVEMMASGLPMIVSRLQGLTETIEENENGLFIEPGNHQDLADKIAALLDDESSRKRMAESSRKRAVEKFSQSNQVRALARILSKETTL